MPVWLTGILTGGFTFLKEWWAGKKDLAQQEMRIKQEIKRSENEMKLTSLTAQINEDTERVKQMSKSLKDEWFTILFSIPLVNMFISPFVDLYFMSEYKDNMLADAAKEALSNLDSAPTWYIIVVLTMVFLSYGYRQGLDSILNILPRKNKESK